MCTNMCNFNDIELGLCLSAQNIMHRTCVHVGPGSLALRGFAGPGSLESEKQSVAPKLFLAKNRTFGGR